ncbi:MAG TPA: type I-U CRISPR-associated protein Csb2 [Bryobacteraceae bacterium]|jgi:CRISPR-associated protein Csb2|nr:type I-U CRISPR-associated protein Csb2 [Bryobacteraceae bacterium]
MTAIELRFLANRYHGTGWGRHVNEGVPEWPPSPYRLLRALYDVWKRNCTHVQDEEVVDLFSALASSQPVFRLPKAVSAHTRSYLSSNTEDHTDKSLIFDAFVATPPGAYCAMQWNVDLTGSQRMILEQLLYGLNYLGRSESWVEARLGRGDCGAFECRPVVGDEMAERKEDVVYVACPVPPSEYLGKRPWFEALGYSSNDLLKERLSGPPAMHYVPYGLPENALTTWLPPKSRPAKEHFSAAILELHGRVLPVATETIRIAERIRGALMRQCELRFAPEAIPPMVHGKDENGIPLRSHSHLFILPRANRLSRIDHVLIFTRHPDGFPRKLAEAIVNIPGLRWAGGLRVITAWMGKLSDHRIRPLTHSVQSSTPFVTVRHWRKGRGTVLDFLKAEIRRECLNHGIAQPVAIEPVEKIGQFYAPEYRRNREGDPARPGYAFRLQFDAPVPAPFSLGYGCHFGLGQFEKA